MNNVKMFANYRKNNLSNAVKAPLFRRSLLVSALMSALLPQVVMAVTSTNTIGPIHGRQIEISSAPVLQGQGLLGQTMTATGQDSTDPDGDARVQWIYKWQRSPDGTSNWQDAVTGNAPDVPDYTIAGADLNQYLRLCLVAEADARSFPVVTKLSDEVCSTVSALVGNVTLSVDDPGVLTVAENQAWAQPLAATSNITNPATLQWSLEGEDAALFDIDAGTGAISLKASQDFENPADTDHNNVYNVTVRVTDSASAVDATRDLNLTVTDIAENMQGNWIVTTNNAAADGAATNVLTFTLTDGVNPVVGETVNISSVPGATLTPTTAVTDANGQVQISVAHTVAESVTVSVNWDDAGQAGSANQAVVFTVSDVIATTNGVLIVDGSNVEVTGNPIVDTTLHSRVTLQGEVSPAAADRTQTPSGKTISYQWQRRDTQVGGALWEDIPAATGVTYQVVGADQGYEFRVDANVQP